MMKNGLRGFRSCAVVVAFAVLPAAMFAADGISSIQAYSAVSVAEINSDVNDHATDVGYPVSQAVALANGQVVFKVAIP